MWWSWLLTVVGLAGFILAGRKVWWCWYINIACQGLWFTYAIVTEQFGFIVASVVYTVVFTQNAIRWTREHHTSEVDPNCPICSPDSARRRQAVRNRKQGGYSPAPRCAAHALAWPPTPPSGPGGGSR